MTYGRKALRIGAVLMLALFLTPIAQAQQSEGQSCGARLTEQLRRFNEKCVADLVSYVASQPNMAAKIYSETDKYYIIVRRNDDGLTAEAVSKLNFPLMKDETANALKQLGWMPPENESANWKKHLGGEAVKGGAAAGDLAKALAAYGLAQGQAISLTVGPDISG